MHFWTRLSLWSCVRLVFGLETGGFVVGVKCCSFPFRNVNVAAQGHCCFMRKDATRVGLRVETIKDVSCRGLKYLGHEFVFIQGGFLYDTFYLGGTVQSRDSCSYLFTFQEQMSFIVN